MNQVSFLILFTILLCSCGLTVKGSKDKTPEVNKETQIPFPHPEEFLALNKHGFMALTPGTKEKCADCHVVSFNLQDATPSQQASSCYQCHSNYPHNFKSAKDHGVLAKKDEASCASCHRSQLNLTADPEISEHLPPTCSSCHSSYPHPSGWLVKKNDNFHGAAVLRDGKESCTSCHGAELQGGTSGALGCQQCHSGSYPHSLDMVEKHKTPEFNLSKARISSECSGCHITEKPKDESSIPLQRYKNQSCQSCHASYPHEYKSWMNKDSVEFHGVVGKKDNFVSCKGCHGEDLKGKGDLRKSCNLCHQSYPHTEEWKTSKLHGEHFVVELSDQNQSCQQCHGSDLQGGRFAKTCNDCHSAYPSKHEKFRSDLNYHSIFVGLHVPKGDDTCVRCHQKDALKAWKQPALCEGCHIGGMEL